MSHSLFYDLSHAAAGEVRPMYPRLAVFFESRLDFADSTGKGLAYGAVGELGDLFPFTMRLILTPITRKKVELHDLYIGAMAEWVNYPAVQAYVTYSASL